jgi:hypothetical protein
LKEKLAAPAKETKITAVGIRCADHSTPLYPQNLALTSLTILGRSVGIRPLRYYYYYYNRGFYPQKLALTSLKGGGRSVGIIRSHTKAAEIIIIIIIIIITIKVVTNLF